MKTTKVKLPKETIDILDAEFADARKREKRKVKELGKKRLNNIEFCHEMVVDDIQSQFHHPEKKYRRIEVTVRITLANGFKYGRTISAVEMPKRFRTKKAANVP